MVILWLTAIVLAVLVLLLARHDHNDWPLLWYGLVFIFLYFGDAIATPASDGLTFSPTLHNVAFRSFAGTTTILLAALTLMLALIVVLTYRTLGSRPRKASAHDSRDHDVAIARGWLAPAPLLLAAPFAAGIIRRGELSAYLANRQLYLNGSALTSLAYYLAPAGAAFSFYCASTSARRRSKVTYLLLALAYVVLCFFSGSRTTALLGGVAPILHYTVSRRSGRQGSSRFGRTALSLLVIAGTLVLAQQYVLHFRGAASSVGGSVFASQDVSQFDATVAVIDGDIRDRNAYDAAFVSLIPRSLWSSKPASGNAVVSKRLYPSRYAQTKAEIAVSIVGEGFLVAGLAGWVGAGLILGGWICAMDRIRRRYARMGHGAEIFAYVYFYRGFNLLRGDLLDFVLPVATTALYLRIALRRGAASGTGLNAPGASKAVLAAKSRARSSAAAHATTSA